ncbi:MAG: ThiF family adenylyltransferase [Candidatus Stahlbacteria bacterium]|nr:ThiF family adenylyltransferase [Candidatus Stahlbacteria bacterium]
MDRYSRQILFDKIGEKGQKKLLNSKVTIIGCGALGTVIANNLTRAGIGYLRIIDRDIVELNNLQRQMLFDETDANASLPKAIAAVNKLSQINSTIKIDGEVADVNYKNVDELIKDVDIVLDGLDNMETRFLINEACVKNNIPWVYGAAVGAIGSTMTIIPGKTACLNCIIGELPSPGTLPTCESVGVLNTITNIIASLETTEALKFLVGEPVNKDLIFIDAWDTSFDKLKIKRLDNCSVCCKKEFKTREAKGTILTTVCCGRDAVQIRPPKEITIPLEDLRISLEKLGEVVFKGYLLVFKIDKYEMIIFPDARVIVKGTRDESIARSLYAKYIGL